ncbi:DUF6988 family protein [Tunturiibacter gelidoferens]|uniref:Uncharacterized protein n=1 Tax=Tunturiibacter gelidiferens TaxID=3069689 RepID=A0A9X0QG37_9BACT|nr:hypothetical protein [Edaphobacter lichenicola]MBB5329806.1 hypothetical protein [Edaphobacter lichenicola]
MIPISVEPYEIQTQLVIDRAENVFRQIVERTPEGLGAADKETLLMTFNSVVIEHFRAICILCRSQMAIGSAFALFRPLVDAALRGEWLYLCASPEQMERFMMRSFDLGSIKFSTMAGDVDRAAGIGRRMEDFTGVYRQMCDFTHTGHDAVVRRLAPDGGIEPTYPEEKIRLLVTQAASVALLHFIVVCKATAHDDVVPRLMELLPLLEGAPSVL